MNCARTPDHWDEGRTQDALVRVFSQMPRCPIRRNAAARPGTGHGRDTDADGIKTHHKKPQPSIQPSTKVRECSNDEPCPYLGLKVPGDIAAGLRVDPSPTLHFAGCGGREKQNAPTCFWWLGVSPSPLLCSRCNCEHTTLRAIKQSHAIAQQVQANMHSRSHTCHGAIDPTLLHASVHLAGGPNITRNLCSR